MPPGHHARQSAASRNAAAIGCPQKEVSYGKTSVPKACASAPTSASRRVKPLAARKRKRTAVAAAVHVIAHKRFSRIVLRRVVPSERGVALRRRSIPYSTE